MNEFLILREWTSIFEYVSMRGRVGIDNGIHFIIRSNENGHNVPHIHAEYQDNNISISLIDFTVLAGNIPTKKQKIAVEWTKNNIDYLKKEYKRLSNGISYEY